MAQIRDWTKVFASLRSGDIEALKKLQQQVDDSGNDQVTLTWELEYDSEGQRLLSIFNIVPNNPGYVIACTLTGLMQGQTVLASGLGTQLSAISSQGDASYTGWLWCSYSPSGSVTIAAQLQGRLQAPDGTDTSFNFSKTLGIGG